MKNELIQFSQADLKTVPSLERVLRLFQNQLTRVAALTDKSLMPPDFGALAKALAKDMSIELSAVGVAPLNLQSLLPSQGNAVFITGTHAQRLAAYPAGNYGLGAAFFETDRNYIYVVTATPGMTWEFAAGVSVGAEADLWGDLGVLDTGTLFFASDTGTMWIWTGSAWTEAGGSVNVAVDGALDGDGTAGDPLAVRVDNVTIEIDGSNNLHVLAAGVESLGYWSPVTNGDPVNPELVFDSFGDIVVAWTPTP